MARSRRTHVSPYKPVAIKPAAGGRLMSNVSQDSAGIPNYTLKRDWRRVLDREVRDAGHTWFWPNTTLPLDTQWIPSGTIGGEPITMLHQSRRPNGELAVIAGTPTKLYRYYSLSDGAYYEGDNTPDEYYLGSDYYESNYGSWILIGSGFQAQAQRWEVEENNGFTILNNGIDLPVTYQTNEFAVRPIYELREVGVAAVGNITVCNDYLLCADISQIAPDALAAIFTPVSAGTITASQVGLTSSVPITGSLLLGFATASAPIFDVSYVGGTISFSGGISVPIDSFVNSTDVHVGGDPLLAVSGETFFLQHPGDTDYTVVASAPFFDAAMVGRQIIWDNGAFRVITAFIDSTHVVVDSNQNVLSGTFSLNNPAAYSPYTNGENIDRIQYRIINGIPGEPRRWGATFPASIVAGSIFLQFEYPATSLFELVGQQILILGAGTLSGNLIATLSYLGPSGMNAIIDTPAITSVTGALVEALDATGANIGFVDLQDDGSGIIAMMDLLGNLIVYKDTSIFIGQYAGTQGSPFNFGKEPSYRGSKSLYHRYTLVSISEAGEQFHGYAGRDSIYRFDMVYQVPVEVKSAEVCKNLFFDNAALPSPTDPIATFAFNNPITKEIYFCFPQADGPDYALKYDYFAGQWSTTSARYTAGVSVKRPEFGLIFGATEDWTIFGTMDGTVLTYGMTDRPIINSNAVTVTQSGTTVTASAPIFTEDMVNIQSLQFPDLSVTAIMGYTSATVVTVLTPLTRAATAFRIIPAIWHRLGLPYDSEMQSGLDNFGNDSGEKDLESVMIQLSSESPNTPFLFELCGTANPSYMVLDGSAAPTIGSKLQTNPKLQSVVSMMFIRNFFQHRITVSGTDNPAEIIQLQYNIAGVDSKNFIQR